MIRYILVCLAICFSQVASTQTLPGTGGAFDAPGLAEYDIPHRNDGANSSLMTGIHGNTDVEWVGKEYLLSDSYSALTLYILEGIPTFSAAEDVAFDFASFHALYSSVIDFTPAPLGDRLWLYGPTYRIGVSDYTTYHVSDRYFTFSNDEGDTVLTLDADDAIIDATATVDLHGHDLLHGKKGQFDKMELTVKTYANEAEALADNIPSATDQGVLFLWARSSE